MTILRLEVEKAEVKAEAELAALSQEHLIVAQWGTLHEQCENIAIKNSMVTDINSKYENLLARARNWVLDLSDAQTASVDTISDEGSISSSSADPSNESRASEGLLRQKLRTHFSERKSSDGASSSDTRSRMNIAVLLNNENDHVEDESRGHRSVATTAPELTHLSTSPSYRSSSPDAKQRMPRNKPRCFTAANWADVAPFCFEVHPSLQQRSHDLDMAWWCLTGLA